MNKPKYSERETRLIVAWVLITGGLFLFVNWEVVALGYIRPSYTVDLLLPSVLLLVGVYILRKKIPPMESVELQETLSETQVSEQKQ